MDLRPHFIRRNATAMLILALVSALFATSGDGAEADA